MIAELKTLVLLSDHHYHTSRWLSRGMQRFGNVLEDIAEWNQDFQNIVYCSKATVSSTAALRGGTTFPPLFLPNVITASTIASTLLETSLQVLFLQIVNMEITD